MESTLYIAGEYVVLAHNKPYYGVKKFTGYAETIYDTGTGTIVKREFRYSFDGKTYAEYQELNAANLGSVKIEKEMWFQFRYLLLTGGPVRVDKVVLQYELAPQPDPYEGYVAPDPTNQDVLYAFPVIYQAGSTWDPYKLTKAVRLYKDLNLMVQTKFGHDVWYFKYNPQARSMDVHLMEQSLYENEPHQCVKVVVPQNQFPDNKMNMGPFGVDFELPFEVQMDKDYFQTVFGEGSGPQKRDVVFFPRTQRIYEVSSSYLFRDFMNVPLYFKISLIKWQPKHNSEMSEDLKTLESFTVGTEKLFGEEIEDQQKQILDPEQFNAAYQDADPVREFLSRDLEITEERLLNYYTVISEYHYTLGNYSTTPKITAPVAGTFTKGTTYYARPFSGATAPVLPDIQYYYSQKKLKFLEISDGKPVFEISAGNSQVESTTPIATLFGPASSLYLYAEEFSGATGGTATSPVASCNTSVSGQSFVEKVVEYKNQAVFPTSEDRTISAWFRLKKVVDTLAAVTSLSVDLTEMDITYSKPISFVPGENLTLKRASGGNFVIFGTVISVIDDKHVKISVKQEILDYLTSTLPAWQGYTDMTLQKTRSHVFVDSIDSNKKGIRVELYENRHFVVTLNETSHMFSFPGNDPGLLDNVWYAAVANISNTFNQLTLNAWKIQWDSTTNIPATTDLKLILNKTVKIDRVDRSSSIHYFVVPSSMDLTNIRVFNKAMETDKQPLVLNQNIVKDAQWSIIIDNALPQQKQPHIGYTR